MRRSFRIRHEFVEFIPKNREDGVVYVSIPYATAVHNCFCGCRTKVVTPISPAGWKLTFDGETISLSPSIGNWAFACQSHYFIRQDRVIWAGAMTEEQIASGRARDRSMREAYFGKSQDLIVAVDTRKSKRSKGFLDWLLGKRT